MELLTLVGGLLGLIVFDLLAMRFGVDSRKLDPRRAEPWLLEDPAAY
jgi:hypothetical protein